MAHICEVCFQQVVEPGHHMKTVGLHLQGIWNYYRGTCHVQIFRKTRQGRKHFSEQVVSVWKNICQ